MKRFTKSTIVSILVCVMLVSIIPVNTSAASRITLVAWASPTVSPSGTMFLKASNTGPGAMNDEAELGSSLWSSLSWSSNSYLAAVSGNAADYSNWANGGDYIIHQDTEYKRSYWILGPISTIGYGDLSLSFSVRSSATGPRNFKVQYTTTCGAIWYDVPDAAYAVTSTSVTPMGPFTIPSDADNAAELNIRMIMTDNARSSGVGNVSTNGTTNIANITLSGESITPIPEPNYVWRRVSSVAELEDGGEYVVYGSGGNVPYSGALTNTVSNGSAGALNMSGYFSGADIVDPPVTAIWMLVRHPSMPNRWALYNQYTRKYMEITGNTTTSFSLTNSPGSYYTVSNSSKWPGAINFTTTSAGSRSIMIFNDTQFRCYAAEGSYGGPTYLYRKTIVGSPIFAPTSSINPGLVAAGTSVSLSQTDGVSIYYTTDGSTPTSSSIPYTMPIVVPHGGVTIKAVAISGNDSSAVITFSYRTILPIAEALQRAGQTVTVEGYATYYATSASGLTNGIYIQDGSNAGIQIFRPSIAATPGCMNKLIQVTGVVTSFNGLMELVIPDDCAIKIIDSNPSPVAPHPTTVQDVQVMTNPFMLVSLTNVQLISVGGTNPNLDYSHTIKQNGRTTTLRAPGLSYAEGSYITITQAIATVNNNSVQVYVNRDRIGDIILGEDTTHSIPETEIASWEITASTPLSSSISATGGVHATGAVFKMQKNNTLLTPTWGGGGMRVTGLDNGANKTWWVAELSSGGYTDIAVSIDMRSSPTGPSEFRVEYSTDGIAWQPAISQANIKINTDVGSGVFETFTAFLPADASEQESLYIRWLLASNIAVNNGQIASGGAHNVNNIVVYGAKSFSTGGNGIALSITENQTYEVSLTAQSITDFAGTTMTIEYNAARLQLITVAAQVHGTYITVGEIPGTGIMIANASQGSISLVFSKTIPVGEIWSGLITVLEFRALTTGATSISIST